MLKELLEGKDVREVLVKQSKNSELTEGFESHVGKVINKEAPYLVNDYYWDKGLNVDDQEVAETIVQILNNSREFGFAQYNSKTKKIEFGKI